MVNLEMLCEEGYFNWKLQLPLLVLLIGVIWFYVWYRKKQM